MLRNFQKVCIIENFEIFSSICLSFSILFYWVLFVDYIFSFDITWGTPRQCSVILGDTISNNQFNCVSLLVLLEHSSIALISSSSDPRLPEPHLEVWENIRYPHLISNLIHASSKIQFTELFSRTLLPFFHFFTFFQFFTLLPFFH